MPITSYASNCRMDGESAFFAGLSIDQNPYDGDDGAGDDWQAGWLAAYAAARTGMGQSVPPAHA